LQPVSKSSPTDSNLLQMYSFTPECLGRLLKDFYCKFIYVCGNYFQSFEHALHENFAVKGDIVKFVHFAVLYCTTLAPFIKVFLYYFTELRVNACQFKETDD